MTQRTLHGVFAPVVTTFDSRTGDLDLEGFASNIAAHLESGQSGVVVCGSTGEAALLEEAERQALISAARRVVPDDRWLIAGTGAESTRATIRRCREARERGADGVLVVAPHYYGSAMTPPALDAHFRRVADASPCPVLLYNIPKYAHLVLEPELIGGLASHDNIVGMKDSAGDLARLARYTALQSETFTVLTGHGGSWAQALASGVSGGILAVALFAADLAFEIFGLHQRGEMEEAAARQRALTPLAAEIVARMGVAGVKSAMELVGLRGGPVRSPLLPLAAEDAGQLDGLLRGAGLAVAA
jgi:4-hydroxy-2-oxoglutarate aldolase